MRGNPVLRVFGYTTLAIAAGLALLAVHTYPTEQTWADRWLDHYHNWRYDLERGPNAMRRDCGWRIILCREMPIPTGALATPLDSAAGADPEFQCTRWTSYDGHALRDSYDYLCERAIGDTTLVLAINDSGLVLSILRMWRPASVTTTYEVLLAHYDSLFGPSALCPQSDDLAIKENRRWQLADYNIGIAKVTGTMIQFDLGHGQIYCHTL